MSPAELNHFGVSEHPRSAGGTDLEHVTVFNTFDEAKAAWLALEAHAHYLPFQSFAWLSSWYAEIGSALGITPHLTLIEDESLGTLLLPLGTEMRGPMRVLTWLGGTVSDYHGPLISHEGRRPSTRSGMIELWESIQRSLPRFDAIHFVRQPDRIGSVRNPFTLLPSHVHDRAYVADIGSDWESYQHAHSGPGSRRRDARYRRRLEERGELRFEIARTPDDGERLTREVVRLKRQAFPIDHHLSDRYERFYVNLARREAGSGVVLACSLELDDQPIAAQWGLVSNGRVAFLLSGYDHGELKRYSPGGLLQDRVMEWCAEHEIPTYDFLIGDEAYKRPWTTDEVKLYESLRSRTALGQLYVATQRLKRAIRRRRRLLLAARRLRDITRPSLAD